MTSQERHEMRYLRRKAKRDARKEELNRKYGDFDKVASFAGLIDGFRKSKRGVAWKASVQRYEASLFRNTIKSHKALMAGDNIAKGFHEFDLCERGKHRHIRSVHISERCIQRSLCDNALVPMLGNSLIYDNGASMQGKGIDFAIDRVTAFLQKHYRKHGTDGYLILVDFTGYFDNIQHKPVYSILNKAFSDKRIVDLTKQCVDAFGDIGLGIGSQVSQILAITLPNAIDHGIEQNPDTEFYERYMDDSLIFVQTKEKAKEIFQNLRIQYEQMGIIVNEKKSQIVKLSHGFTFLKTKFYLAKTGKVIKKPCRDNIIRMRRKLKKFKAFLDAGIMTFQQINTAYQSWKGCMLRKNAYHAIRNMNALFNQLFIKDFMYGH